VILSSEVVRVRRRKGVIKPVYASETDVSLTKTLVSVFEEHVGRTRGELKEALSGCEMLGFDYKLVRGLSSVLEERCVFGSRGVIDPSRVRRSVFEEAGRRIVVSDEDRRGILGAASFRLGVSAYDLERSLYADLQAEQELQEFQPVTSIDLLKGYNFSLLVTLLAHARHLEVIYESDNPAVRELCSGLGKCNFSEGRGSSKVSVELPARLSGYRASHLHDLLVICNFSEGRGSSKVSVELPARLSGYRASHLHDLLVIFLGTKRWSLKAEVVYPSRSKKFHTFEERSENGEMISPLQAKEEPLVEPSTRRSPRVRVRSEVIDVQRTAERLGVTEEEVRGMVGGRGYVDLGGVLVAGGKLREVKEALSGLSDMRFGEIRRVLRGLGVKEPVPLLEALGYVVEWNRDRDESLVYRI